MKKKSLGTLILLWLGWFLLLYGLQAMATARFAVERPDTAVFWSQYLTGSDSEERSVYLQDPFLNDQVAWDSEYYIGIAVAGYDDPLAGRETNPESGLSTPRNYAFFPLYPYLMRALAVPLRVFGLTPIATATLAGVILSLLGTLAGMTALYDLTREYFDEAGRLRTVFYMLIFPTAFFFAQVYSEGLFIGLAFWSLAFAKRGKWLGASLLAALAAWTRAYGAILALPLAYAWGTSLKRENLRPEFLWKWALQGVGVLLPVLAFLLWYLSPLGKGWAELQEYLFGRGFLSVENSIHNFHIIWEHAAADGPAGVYFGIQVFLVAAAFLSGLALLRRDPLVALFSLAVVIFSAASGTLQSNERYILTAPAVYIVLGYLGGNRVFDRAWTVASLLLLGMSATLFAFNFWAG